VLGLDDLVPDGGRLLKRIGICDRVDQHECVRRRYGQGAHGRKLVRAGSVQYVQVDFHAVHRELAVVHFLHGSLVLGRELSVQELRDQRRLAHPRRAHHHDLVPCHVTRIGRRRWWLQLVVMVVTALNAATVKTKLFSLFSFSYGEGDGVNTHDYFRDRTIAGVYKKSKNFYNLAIKSILFHIMIMILS